jgi:transcriptional regulator with XRE-family HTH domain
LRSVAPGSVAAFKIFGSVEQTPGKRLDLLHITFWSCTHFISMLPSCSPRRSNITLALPFCHVRLSGPKPLPKAYSKHLKTLGDHIRKRRLDLGLPQKDVAERIGADVASICNWESNCIQPMVHCLAAVIGFLGYNPLPEADDLIGKFKRLRISLGLTQEQLAQKLGIDESTIAGWERRDNTPVGPSPQTPRRFRRRRRPPSEATGRCRSQK